LNMDFSDSPYAYTLQSMGYKMSWSFIQTLTNRRSSFVLSTSWYNKMLRNHYQQDLK